MLMGFGADSAAFLCDTGVASNVGAATGAGAVYVLVAVVEAL